MAHSEDNQALLPEERQTVKESVETGRVGEVEGSVASSEDAGSSKKTTDTAPAIQPTDPSAPANSAFDKSSEAPIPDSGTAESVGSTTAPAAPSVASQNPASAEPTSGARPTLVQLGNGPASTGSGSPATQHKKFTAVNISKKFFEKNSTASASSPSASSSSGLRSTGPLLRPAITTATSHPRLVTTKLTANSQSSTSPGPGWSRPSSATPSASGANPSPTPSVPNGASLFPQGSSASSLAPGASSMSSAPQLPHVSKLVQPQPRVPLAHSAVSATAQKGGVGGKTVWGNVKVAQSSPAPDSKVQNDFPTAAEVAQATTPVKLKAVDPKTSDAQESVVSSKQLRNEEADTFRGVHLDPNAHHWDEMEEDDDNFLDDVIDFGDGRQYKIEAVATQPSPEGSSLLDGRTHPTKDEIPVSKEERFADDFDRSWPRTRPSPSIPPRGLPSAAAHSVVSSSPASSHQHYSPQEQSRVLFNERSNRLEPYSSASHNGQHGQHGQHGFRGNHEQPFGNGKRMDYSTSPSESRRSRDLPSVHTNGPGNVQLLQKQAGNDLPQRPRAFSGSSGFSGHGPSIYRDRERDRDHSRRENPPATATFPSHSSRQRDGFNPGGSPVLGRDFRDSPTEQRGRRPFNSSMGPPPVPSHAKDGVRQLPPHLAQGPPSAGPHPRESQPFSRESRYPRAPSSVASSRSAMRSRSPSLSQRSGIAPSLVHGVAAELIAPHLSAPELDNARKDLMHTAAERAKQRRLQEEEEREREKERARKKAAEIEEKMKALEAEKLKEQQQLEEPKRPETIVKESEAIALIEEAVKSAQPHPARPNFQRTPSLQASQRVAAAAALSPTTPLTPAIQAETWRRKAQPPPVNKPLEPQHPETPTSAKPSFTAPPPSVLQQVESSLAETPSEDLEVVDFSDLGQLVGAPDGVTVPAAVSQRAQRPTAADFFDAPEEIETKPPSHEAAVWRRTDSSVATLEHDRSRAPQPKASGDHPVPPHAHAHFNVNQPSAVHPREMNHADDGQEQIITAPHHNAQLRTPRSQAFYKEATISALDDAMSRIKGALDGMHHLAGPPHEPHHDGHLPSGSTTSMPLEPSAASATSQKSLPKERWVPPALRPQKFDPELMEPFATGCEPPRSPKPAWNTYHVRLPRASQSREPIHKRQLYLATRPPLPARWEMLLSFDPPLFGMHRRDFSLNEALFGKPMFKGKIKYRVSLPRLRGTASGLRVSLPSPATAKPNGAGAFGRLSADGLSTWRKPAGPASPLSPKELDHSELNTMSRSPPPDLPAGATQSSDAHADQDSSKSDNGLVRQRSQPKMPAGSSVAFYRDSRVDAVETTPKTAVKFIVTSELDESNPEITVSAPSQGVRAPNGSASPRAASPSTPEFGIPPLASSKAESKASDGSTDRGPITPPPNHSATSPWSKSYPIKESPARGPDREHLKALWSQPSEKTGVAPVNSLQAISDDLPALPFTLQEVKSEGGTPPPTTAPSRISQHDITRSFQQVPSSSSSSSNSAAPQRTPLSPATTSSQAARPPAYAYAVPVAGQAWPAYSYPSPMMSPAQPMMYSPHPMGPSQLPPGRMPVNGHAPVYGQPVWVQQVPGQNPNMRSMPAPYSPQFVTYPAPGTPPMFAHSPQAVMQAPAHQNPSAGNRGRNVPMMSPVVSHAAAAHPMYPGSPILMHSPAMPVSQNHPYMPGRSQLRTDAAHSPAQAHHPQPPHPSPYTQVPPSSFSRTAW
ncbi:hypothetical protein HGRIS_007605 [Hohenbuehelia grisea]|uniref:Uncharacterized protein n=1 Tax=Hohenbuehelia grisea TaxID=104357 RepID=A0ABR3J5J0_9AGAR